MMALAGLWSLFNLVVLVLLVVLAIFGIQALRKYLKTPAALPAAGGLSLGARLCRQRQARGMTVESVAQSLGITPRRWRPGKRTPPTPPTSSSWTWLPSTEAPLRTCFADEHVSPAKCRPWRTHRVCQGRLRLFHLHCR